MKSNRSIKVLLILICFLGIGVYVFGQDKKLTILHGPYLQYPTDTSITIVWFTNKNCVSKVEYILDEGLPFNSSKTITVQNSRHGLIDASTNRQKIRIGDLEPGRKYKYRIFSKEILKFKPYKVTYGDSIVYPNDEKETFHFQTLDPFKNKFSFVVINDIHEHAEKLDAMLNTISWDSTDLIFFNGDMIDHFESLIQIFDKFLDVCVRRFASEIPICYVRGNHEARGVLARTLINYFPTETGKFYRTFIHGPVCFVILDSGEDKPDSHWAYSGLTDFDSYRLEQSYWLKNVIQSDPFRKAKFKIVLMHIPPFGGNGWYGEMQLRKLFVPLFNEGEIDLLICGHTHRYKHIESFKFKNNFPVIINGANTVLTTNVLEDQLKITITKKNGKIRDVIFYQQQFFLHD